MKRILTAMLLLTAMAGCRQKPVTIDGTIIGYAGQEVSATVSKDLSREDVKIAEDGSFHIEKMLSEAVVGGLSIMKGGSHYDLIIPGKHYEYCIDMTKTPTSWSCQSDCPAEQAFYRYMIDTLLKIDYSKYVFPEKFADYDAMWEDRLDECRQRIRSVKDRSALRYFNETIDLSIARNRVNFANQMAKNNLKPADDPDYMAFFNSVDLSDERMLPLLSSMLTIKSDMYSDTIPASVRYLQAIDELAPSREVNDSLSMKYIDRVIKDGKFASRQEADVLLGTAERLVEDKDLLEAYRTRVEKVMTLACGNDAIDFQMIDAKGKTVRLSDFKGKVVYVDFWATWCIPCCLQIPYMKAVAAKYASVPDVACISVSLDSDLDSWKSKLQFDKPEWPQYVAEDAGKQIMSDYAFQAIPRFMIFDKEGKIVTVNAPRPQDMEEVVGIIDSLL